MEKQTLTCPLDGKPLAIGTIYAQKWLWGEHSSGAVDCYHNCRE
jgi:hypothetical protein